MIEQYLTAIIEAEKKAKEILDDGKKEYEKIILQGEEDIEKEKEDIKLKLKLRKEEKKQQAETDSKNLYEKLIEEKTSELNNQKLEIKAKAEDLEKEIIKEILDKWLL